MDENTQTAADATRDVVVIGGGIAGLTAALRLRHRDVVVLEASDRVGGRMRSEAHGDYWLNYGAHLFPAPGSLVDSIATELSLETVPVWGSMMGLAVGDTKLTSGPIESYPLRPSRTASRSPSCTTTCPPRPASRWTRSGSPS